MKKLILASVICGTLVAAPARAGSKWNPCQFRLRTFLIAVVPVAGYFGWYNYEHTQRAQTVKANAAFAAGPGARWDDSEANRDLVYFMASRDPLEQTHLMYAFDSTFATDYPDLVEAAKGFPRSAFNPLNDVVPAYFGPWANRKGPGYSIFEFRYRWRLEQFESATQKLVEKIESQSLHANLPGRSRRATPSEIRSAIKMMTLPYTDNDYESMSLVYESPEFSLGGMPSPGVEFKARHLYLTENRMGEPILERLRQRSQDWDLHLAAYLAAVPEIPKESDRSFWFIFQALPLEDRRAILRDRFVFHNSLYLDDTKYDANLRWLLAELVRRKIEADPAKPQHGDAFLPHLDKFIDEVLAAGER